MGGGGGVFPFYCTLLYSQSQRMIMTVILLIGGWLHIWLIWQGSCSAAAASAISTIALLFTTSAPVQNLLCTSAIVQTQHSTHSIVCKGGTASVQKCKGEALNRQQNCHCCTLHISFIIFHPWCLFQIDPFFVWCPTLHIAYCTPQTVCWTWHSTSCWQCGH